MAKEIEQQGTQEGTQAQELQVPQGRVHYVVRAQLEQGARRITITRTEEPDYDGGVLYRVFIWGGEDA